MSAYLQGIYAAKACGLNVVRVFAGHANLHARTIYLPTDYGQVPVILDHEDFDNVRAAARRHCCSNALALEGMIKRGEIKVRVPCRARWQREPLREDCVDHHPGAGIAAAASKWWNDNHYRGARP